MRVVYTLCGSNQWPNSFKEINRKIKPKWRFPQLSEAITWKSIVFITQRTKILWSANAFCTCVIKEVRDNVIILQWRNFTTKFYTYVSLNDTTFFSSYRKNPTVR